MVINPYRAKFELWEGVDGSGKSRQFELAKELLRGRADVFFTKEPTDLPSGRLVYDILRGKHPTLRVAELGFDGLQRLYFQDRLEHTRQRLVPRLSSGIHVLSDRGILSSAAFGSKSEDDFERIFGIGEDVFANTGVPLIWPNKILIYDVPVQIAMQRLCASGKPLDQIEEDEAKLRLVIEMYRKLARRYPNCVLIDAQGSPEEVFEETKRHLLDVL